MVKKSGPSAIGRRLFRNISRLYTLQGAMAKAGRRVQKEDLSLIENAAMIANGGRIEWVGREVDLAQERKGDSHAATDGAIDETIDLQGATVLPAFLECHTHLIYAGNRSAEFERRLAGESYQSIAESGGGILATVLPTRAAAMTELVAIGQKRVNRFLRQGVTTIEAKSGYGLTLESELNLLRAAGRLQSARVVPTFLGAHALPPEAESAHAYLMMLESQALPAVARESLAKRVDIFIEHGYFSADLARPFLHAAQNLGFDLVIHADQLTRSGGALLAVELGARSAEHLLQIEEAEISALAASEVTCVLLPSADLYMQCKYPPARALIDRGARVALATDLNPGTSPSQDLALVGVLARLKMQMSFAETLAAYTVGAAFALGLEKDLGALTPGRYCDFTVLTGSIDEIFLEVGQMPVAQVFCEAEQVWSL
jgi:imidazolonepropionase